MEKIANMNEYRQNIRHDGRLPLAVGKSRTEKKWKNRQMPWSQILKKLEEPVRTAETHAEYMKLSKSRQDQIKDVGGFIGGSLKDGRRKAENVTERQIITLDADFAPPYMLEDMELLTDYNYAVYSTHKHCPEKPRLRILIPLKRPVTPDEYEAVGRKLAEEIGIDYFDDTTYQPSRLMYWPSVSSDGEYIFRYYDNPWLDPDEVLARYPDWTDTSYWPESSRTAEKRKRTAKKQGDPCEKRGLIGAFCRTYSIGEAIDKFLPDIYEPCAMQGRYTYREGSTAAGLVLYDDRFAYSNHATDPASGRLCNAFDLIRIHRYGLMDEDTNPDTAVTKLPSYKEMLRFVQEDKDTKMTVVSEKRQEISEEFAETDDEGWKAELELTDNGGLRKSLTNLALILAHDPNLKGIRLNQMSGRIDITEDVPWVHTGHWRDADDAQLEVYLAKNYCEFPKAKVVSGLTKAAEDRGFHPVRDYLDGLPEWDGIERVDTQLIEYLAAEDTPYTRAVTRKTLCAAVMRVMHPGCKFDYMLVLNGPQGVGKSTWPSRLGGPWFSDALSLADTKDKTAAEKLQGNWIMEIPELSGMRKADIETMKAFITRQDDKYRASYGRVVQSHPRQCIIIGTTNAQADGFIRDNTGGRRFWPVAVNRGKKHPGTLAKEDVDQIWAEVLAYVKAGEKLYLSQELEESAGMVQQKAMEKDDREGLIREYLDKPLPENWDKLNLYERREFLYGDEFGKPSEDGTVVRQEVSNMEIWCECLGRSKAELNRKNSYEISAIMNSIEGWSGLSEKAARIPLYGPQKIRKRL